MAYHPRIGRRRSELAPELRSFAVQDYVILYRPMADGVEVVRILHGSRDIESLF
ncbi:MAG: type II toxin-antitoxin system RelE/ParE family toxin [SAR202 cluster bacterium]|nr:type II toxin-antitoxin system RelE/ParE family toxin [SAR202 cluster bacterium]